MKFDLFHSFSDPVIKGQRLGAKKSLVQLVSQVRLAEELGMGTAWVAESHFSSETQKLTTVATIPEFSGEVGLNCDSFQLLSFLMSQTERIGFGTAIHNIVGGSGGPLASAERIGFFEYLNRSFLGGRQLEWGIASGRFPYQNTPFGIVPRNSWERDNWNAVKGAVFLEALEIFVRLLKGEELASSDIAAPRVDDRKLPRRWSFEKLSLVPKPEGEAKLVIGSQDPKAFSLASRYFDVDLFNLSFTPPAQIERLHEELGRQKAAENRVWHRSRLPRTVMVFIDPQPEKARALASHVLDTYIEAMRGTAQVPDKAVLMERALIGDAGEIREQLAPGATRGFHPDDRLMLWFEFNQLSGESIEKQMRYFMEEVAGKL